MDARGASYEDVRVALVGATRCALDKSTGHWIVTGKDTDRDELTLAVAIENNVVVVTVGLD